MISFKDYLTELSVGTLQSYQAKRGDPKARQKTALAAIDHVFSKKPGQAKHQIHGQGLNRARQKIEKHRQRQTAMNPQKPRPHVPQPTGFGSGAIDDTKGT